MACIVAATCRPMLLGSGPLFPFAETVTCSPLFMGFCLLVGIISGLGSGIATALVYGFEDFFQKLPIHWM